MHWQLGVSYPIEFCWQVCKVSSDFLSQWNHWQQYCLKRNCPLLHLGQQTWHPVHQDWGCTLDNLDERGWRCRCQNEVSIISHNWNYKVIHCKQNVQRKCTKQTLRKLISFILYCSTICTHSWEFVLHKIKDERWGKSILGTKNSFQIKLMQHQEISRLAGLPWYAVLYMNVIYPSKLSWWKNDISLLTIRFPRYSPLISLSTHQSLPSIPTNHFCDRFCL